MELIHTVFQPRGAGPHAAILTLHGWGANALDLLGLAPYLSQGRFLVVCPQGTMQTPLGPGAVGYGWYPISMGQPPDAAAMFSACEHLWRFVDAALEQYPIDAQRLVVLGFSQGGVMAYNLALSHPERFVALVALSTWLPPKVLEARQRDAGLTGLPILIQHGTRDELIQVERARQSVEALRPCGMPLTYREYDMGHEINAQSLMTLSAWLDDTVP